SQKVIRQGKSSDPRYVATLEGMALGYQKQGMYLSALDQLKEALSTLNAPFLKDRARIGQVMELEAKIYETQGKTQEAKAIRTRISQLSPWWQWFWSCFIIAFATEALYLANVLARPDDIDWRHFKVENGFVYAWSVIIATVGMIRGLMMHGMIWHEALFLGMGLSLALMPLIFGFVLMAAQNLSPMDSQKLLEAPSRKRTETH
ncbi:MAG: tetratricopeptide repeat protein, partial [Candidatus Obscuribacterales bacterium]|nr:tetratricopeptide repeat protein [Candidatus Obscuribacterales bacterium]